MAFNYHSVLKSSLKMNEAKLDFQLPKIPLKAAGQGKNISKDASSFRSNKKANSSPKQAKKSGLKNQRVLVSYPKIKKPVQQSQFNKQNKTMGPQKQRNTRKLEIKPKNQNKNKSKSGQSCELSMLFLTISNTISGSESINLEGPVQNSRASKRNEKYLKRSVLAKKNYQMNRPQIIGEKISLSKSSGGMLQNLEHHMSAIFDLEEQASNSLKQLIENRGILDNLMQHKFHKKKLERKA